jgi:hypothetical protein
MQVLPDIVIINASPSQKELLRNPKHRQYIKGMIIDLDNWNRPRIPVAEIPDLIERLRELQSVISDDPEYSDRQPKDVIERIILNIEDAAAAQLRAYPPIPK